MRVPNGGWENLGRQVVICCLSPFAPSHLIFRIETEMNMLRESPLTTNDQSPTSKSPNSKQQQEQRNLSSVFLEALLPNMYPYPVPSLGPIIPGYLKHPLA